VIVGAAAARLRVFELTSPTPAFEAWLIAAGAMLFLLGSAGFRLALQFGAPWPRAVGAVASVLAVPASMHVAAAVGLVVITIVIAGTLVVEHAVERADQRRRLVETPLIGGTGAAP
jgi:hypothetical protein